MTRLDQVYDKIRYMTRLDNIGINIYLLFVSTPITPGKWNIVWWDVVWYMTRIESAYEEIRVGI